MRRVLLLLPLLVAGVLSGTVAATAAPAPAAGERWALLVGIDRFQGGTRPNYGAVADVADVQPGAPQGRVGPTTTSGS